MSSRKRSAWTENRQQGFTLIEVMVALTVVAFALVGLLGLHNRNLAIVARDQDMAVGTLLARRLIAQMELVEGFPDIGSSSGQIDDVPGFHWERQVEETTQEDVREVRLRVIRDGDTRRGFTFLYYIRDHRDPELLQ